MKKWRVTYYYLATGMEGRPDVEDYGIHEAETAKKTLAGSQRNNETSADPT